VKILPDRASFDSHIMIHHIFPEIEREIAKIRPEMRLKELDFHMSNAQAGIPGRSKANLPIGPPQKSASDMFARHFPL